MSIELVAGTAEAGLSITRKGQPIKNLSVLVDDDYYIQLIVCVGEQQIAIPLRRQPLQVADEFNRWGEGEDLLDILDARNDDLNAAAMGNTRRGY